MNIGVQKPQYTYLRSDFTIINDSYLEKTQKISYIGIPLKGSFKIWQQQKFSIYTSAGLTLDIPVKATLEELTSENRLIISQKKSRLYPHLQWSADFGIGIQYHITPSIGIYTEPNLRYYFNDGSRLNTIRATKPFNMTLPIGIRLSWQKNFDYHAVFQRMVYHIIESNSKYINLYT